MGFPTAPQPVIDRTIFPVNLLRILFFYGENEAVTTDSIRRERRPATENVWYNLLTIAGTVIANPLMPSIGLHEKSQLILDANRRYWNGYFRHCLDKEEHRHFGDALPILDDEELAHIQHVMAKRGFDTLPTDVSLVDLAFADAGAMDLVLTGFCFMSLSGVAFKTQGSIDIAQAKIKHLVYLGGAKAYGFINFTDAKIAGSITLNNVEIGEGIWLDGAHIDRDISCLNTSAKGLNFTAVTCGHADFTDAHFSGPCDFRNTDFPEVPKFFGTQLHEDTTWRGVKWPKAATNKENAAERIRRYDRLRLMMSQLKKPVEEQRFQALSLREQRIRDGVTLPSLLNWLYDHGWEYGYGLSKATGLWLGHILLGAIAIGVTQAPAQGSFFGKLSTVATQTLVHLPVSFSNSMPFLGLHRGGLEPLYDHLGCAAETAGIGLCAFGVLWAVQGVLGTVLFFFLLVTVRNVYRL